MTKQIYLAQLMSELKKQNVEDADRIVIEFRERFAFKLADGFYEEEIPTKLGDPAMLALQCKQHTGAEQHFGINTSANWGSVQPTISSRLFTILAIGWKVILAAISVASATLAICLFGGFNLYLLVPPIPYWCGAVFGLAFAALAVLTGIVSFFHSAFAQQHVPSQAFFKRKGMSVDKNKVLSVRSDESCSLDKADQRIRYIAHIAITMFAVSFFSGMIASMLSTGVGGFWHAWGWFRYFS